MTPYHKIMQSLVAHGYVHEWKFGDRAWHNNREWVAVSVQSGGTKIYLWSEHEDTTIITQKGGTPLPTVDQWMEKLWSYNLTIESGLGNGYLCRWNSRKQDNPSIYDDDIRIALAILYARITLNLKWNEKKGEFER